MVLLCSRERETKFPFDIQHRTIIHYTAIATSLAVRNLLKLQLVERKDVEDESNSFSSTYEAYVATGLGMDWLEKNTEHFEMKTKPQRTTPTKQVLPTDDSPF